MVKLRSNFSTSPRKRPERKRYWDTITPTRARAICQDIGIFDLAFGATLSKLPKVEPMHRAQSRKEKMEKIIQCTVCLSLPFCKIYQCPDGHLICMDCYSKMPKPISCPSCRTPMPATPIRNRAAEQVRS